MRAITRLIALACVPTLAATCKSGSERALPRINDAESEIVSLDNEHEAIPKLRQLRFAIEPVDAQRAKVFIDLQLTDSSNLLPVEVGSLPTVVIRSQGDTTDALSLSGVADAAERQLHFQGVVASDSLPAASAKMTADVTFLAMDVQTWTVASLTVGSPDETLRLVLPPFDIDVGTDAQGVSMRSAKIGGEFKARGADMGHVLTHSWATDAARVFDSRAQQFYVAERSSTGGATFVRRCSPTDQILYPVRVQISVPSAFSTRLLTIRAQDLRLSQ